VEHIADRLVSSIRKKKSPVIIGLDPVYESIPRCIKEKYALDIDGVAQAVLEFNTHVIDAICDIVPAVKPQSAFYELLGWRGIQILEETTTYAKSKGLIVVEDSKRGDIGNTSKAYADAHLGSLKINDACVRAAESDYMTISPFLGIDGIDPFLEVAEANNRGVFILVRTSNPDSSLIQLAITQTGEAVADELAGYIAAKRPNHKGQFGYTSIGAVVGATYPTEARRLRKLMPESFFLVPGYGAQGATAQDVVPFFNSDGLGALINASRSVLYAYKKSQGEDCSLECFKGATRAAALEMRDAIYQELKLACSALSY
jgi:orotidine-5'-phosphate decarboxylase